MRTGEGRWFAGALITGLLLGAVACGNSTASATPGPPTPSPSPRTTLVTAEQSLLTQLEARPLRLPPMPAGGSCSDGPHTSSIVPYENGAEETDVYGLGPVYGQGGPEVPTSKNRYFDVTYFTDPSVQGVVLVRGQGLDGEYKLVFVGPYATGPVVGTDTISGVQTELHSELAFPVASPPANAGAAPGWGVWRVRQGIDRNFKCVGLQIDTPSSSQDVVSAA